jgi:beta-galactosidase/beta-glucuronidase
MPTKRQKNSKRAGPLPAPPPPDFDPIQHKGYPRPMLQRADWTNLNGAWDFAFDVDACFTAPSQVSFDRQILVPFSPETPASGVADTGFYNAVWYRRAFEVPQLSAGSRLILHFGAVDTTASVWVNGQLAAGHEGGYTPFHADITDMLSDDAEQTLVVRAFDDPQDLAKPRGKQDWLRDAHSIWYPRTTGIWQTVWMEVVPATHVSYLRWTPVFEKWSIQLDAAVDGPGARASKLRVMLSSRGSVLVDDTYAVAADAHVCRTISLPDPGIDDARNALLWFPHAPNLIDARLTLLDANGKTLDTVTSYTAMRGVGIIGDRFFLNGRPYKLQLVLDQGYWTESGLSAPSDAALKHDVELVKQLGFNGVRKHQKIEDPRFLYWADHLGLLVWGEMPSPYSFTQRTIERMASQWLEALHRDVSHPCIVAWVPVNESWGVPDLPIESAQRKFVAGLYSLTKAIDPSRPCIGNDGWETGAAASDIIGIHDYDADTARIARRYAHTAANIAHLLQNETPGNKVILLDGFTRQREPIMLSEFGGIAFSKDHAHTWGYSRANTAEAFALRYYRLMDAVRSLPLLAGWCYTQFTDTYQEANGLLYMDRTPKFPIEQIAVATRGAWNEADHAIEENWRKQK